MHGLNFNRFSIIFQRWKNDFDRQYLSHSYLLSFSSNFTIPVTINAGDNQFNLVFLTKQELFLYVKY